MVAGLLLFMASMVYGAEISYYATDMSMRVVNEFAPKVPFLVHAVVTKASQNVDVQVPELVQKYRARKTGVQINTINGVSQIRHSYTVSIADEGNYSLGKAIVTIGKAQYISDELHVVINNSAASSSPVVTNVTMSQTQGSNAQLYEPKAVITFDVQNPYKCQEVTGYLYIYYDPRAGGIQLYEFVLPSSDQYRIANVVQAGEGRTQLQGYEYAYVKFDFSFVPLHTGEVAMQSFSLSYEYPQQVYNQSIWNQLHSFFNRNVYQIRVPTASVHVREVPLYNGSPVMYIGHIDQCMLQVNPLVIDEHEAATITLTLEGKGAFELYSHPVLTAIDTCTSYQSSSSIEIRPNGKKIKKFEYVVQPHVVGTIEIPAQVIVTFDPLLHEHIVLHTDMQHLVVKSTARPKSTESSSQMTVESHALEAADLGDHAVMVVDETENGLKNLSLWVVLCLIVFDYFWILILIGLWLYFFYNHGHTIYDRIRVIILYYGAFYFAKLRLKQIRQSGKTGDLFDLFVTLVMHRRQPSLVVGYFFLYELPKNYALAIDSGKWRAFVEVIGDAYFVDGTRRQQDELVRQAETWIDILRKKGL